MRLALGIDLRKCIGCGACTAACLAENLGSPTYYPQPPLATALAEAAKAETPEEAREPIERLWLRTSIHRIYTGKPPHARILFYHRVCQHCDNAPCVTVCPTGASYQREDGIVLVDHEKCILCGYCITACPYAARNVNHYTRTVDKCTLCAHRIDQGQEPACVATCPTGARVYGDLEDPTSPISRLIAERGAVPGTPRGPLPNTNPRTYYAP